METMDGVVLLIAIVLGIAVFVVYIVFLSTLSKTLKLAGDHSQMSPGMVYLNLIPIFNLGWIFYTVIRVSEAVKGKCGEIGQDAGDGGYGIGIAYACCVVGSIIPCIGFLAALASLVLWIVYWVKIAGYNEMMMSGGSEIPV